MLTLLMLPVGLGGRGTIGSALVLIYAIPLVNIYWVQRRMFMTIITTAAKLWDRSPIQGEGARLS